METENRPTVTMHVVSKSKVKYLASPSNIQKVAWELIPSKAYSLTHVQCTHTVAGGKRQRQFTFVTIPAVTTIILYGGRGV